MQQPTDVIEAFIIKWTGVAASELSTSQSFLADLCRLLDVDTPHPTADQDYMFERPITFRHGDGSTSAGRIDLYRRGAFVLESKKLKAATHTKGFDDGLLRARSQAEAYARALPVSEGRPPFVVVVDVGNRIELYSEFSRSGATYTPFPDPSRHRIALADLRRPEILDRLRRLWSDPLSLDPSRESARVTREIAGKLASLARSLEETGNAPEPVAQFLMRCLFTMFAEDVGLLPPHAFRDLLAKHGNDPEVAGQMLGALWRDMDTGGFSAVLANKVLRFNGKLFKAPAVLPLTKGQLQALLEAAQADWRHVEPAIFGTLLERALSPGERHKLGAHYTPRAYVERLVLPTVIEPLRAEWSSAHAAALTLAAEDRPKEAVAEVLAFHHRLCSVRVLDPACGSGNFLYVVLEHLKRLEGEVLNVLDELGHRQSGLDLDAKRADVAAGETVDPHNLLGIELNPRAAALAELVLWIGYLQWHFLTRGDVNPPEPVVRDFRNIENRDAVLSHDGVEAVTDEQGVPLTRWDGETTKLSPVTGEPVPDESARKPVEVYLNPRKAAWPESDFVVGNPPFIGASTMRSALGEGYVEALRGAWTDVPESADFVMYWWHSAASLARRCAIQRFGFITTNSIKQTLNRRVIEAHLSDPKQPLSLSFAIPDHPWVDESDGAAVRIAMTVGIPGADSGRLLFTTSERNAENGEVDVDFEEHKGLIHQDLSIGANTASAKPLRAMRGISSPGLKLHGAGFIVSDEQAVALGLGRLEGLDAHLRPYRNGRDLTSNSREARVIDLFGLDEADVRQRFPEVYQHLLERVRPEREAKAGTKDGAVYARLWWWHGKPRQEMRKSLAGLGRYIATVETSKHTTFQFLGKDIAPDNMLIAISLDDGASLGVLSSAIHVTWALALGGRLGVGNDPRYNKSRCFETFPFPATSPEQLQAIASHAERLDAHRKRQQARYSDLTLTGMYNVLAKLRSGEPLNAKDRDINEHGLVSVLGQLHDDLDASVVDAYGWHDLLSHLRIAHGNAPANPAQSQDDAKRLFDAAVLERLVALNAERAAEEANGLVRWLRPDFQHPARGAAPAQAEIEHQDEHGSAPAILAAATKPAPWPKEAVDQARAVAALLATSPIPLSVEDIAGRFTSRGPWKRRLPQLLDMLVAVGRAEQRGEAYASR